MRLPGPQKDSCTYYREPGSAGKCEYDVCCQCLRECVCSWFNKVCKCEKHASYFPTPAKHNRSSPKRSRGQGRSFVNTEHISAAKNNELSSTHQGGRGQTFVRSCCSNNTSPPQRDGRRYYRDEGSNGNGISNENGEFYTSVRASVREMASERTFIRPESSRVRSQGHSHRRCCDSFSPPAADGGETYRHNVDSVDADRLEESPGRRPHVNQNFATFQTNRIQDFEKIPQHCTRSHDRHVTATRSAGCAGDVTVEGCSGDVSPTPCFQPVRSPSTGLEGLQSVQLDTTHHNARLQATVRQTTATDARSSSHVSYRSGSSDPAGGDSNFARQRCHTESEFGEIPRRVLLKVLSGDKKGGGA